MTIRHFWSGPLRAEAADADAGGGGETAPPSVPAQLVEMQARMDALEASNAELEETAKFWEAKASKGGEPEPQPKPAYDPAADIEEINAKGYGAIEERFDRWSKQKGLMTQGEAQAAIQEATTIQAIAREHPDLAVDGSEFRKTFVRHLGDLEGLPKAKQMALAAKLTKAELQAAGKYKQAESEEQRIERILAQSGVPTIKRAAGGEAALDAKGKEMAAAFGVSEKQFQEHSSGLEMEYTTRAGGER